MTNKWNQDYTLANTSYWIDNTDWVKALIVTALIRRLYPEFQG